MDNDASEQLFIKVVGSLAAAFSQYIMEIKSSYLYPFTPFKVQPCYKTLSTHIAILVEAHVQESLLLDRHVVMQIMDQITVRTRHRV